MDAFYSLLGVVLLGLAFGFVVARVEGLALFAPKSTKGIAASADGFCRGHCRLPDGRCPLTGSVDRAADCPLWRYVRLDVPTAVYGSPFAQAPAPPAGAG